MQNTAILQITQVFFCMATPTPYIARARDGLRELSDHAQRMETRGFRMNRATEDALASVYKRSFSGDT